MNRPIARWCLRAAAVACLVTVAYGCLLAGPSGNFDIRGAVPPVTSSVEPTFICPGDPVTVTWDGGPVDDCESVGDDAQWGSGCDETITRTAVTVESTPDLFAANPVAASETRGSRTVNPTGNTTITVGFTRANGDLSYSQPVQVAVFDSDDLQPARFPRRCPLAGGAGFWDVLEVRPAGLGPDLPPPARMQVVEVCNPNVYGVEVTIDGRAFPLDPGACTGELRPVLPDQVSMTDIEDRVRPSLVLGEDCRPPQTSGTQVAGQSVPMQARLSCEPD